jgi:hypothetical protein
LKNIEYQFETEESPVSVLALNQRLVAQQFAENLHLLVSREINEAVHFKTELCETTYKTCLSFQLSKKNNLPKLKTLVRHVAQLAKYQDFDISFENHPHGRGIIRLEPHVQVAVDAATNLL